MEEKKFIKKVKEIIEPARGPMLDVVSDLFVPEIAEEIARNFVPAVVAGVVGEVAGSLIPGVGSMIMSYKQAQFERNIERMVSELMKRMDEFNQYFAELDDEIALQVKKQYFGIMADHAVSATQEEKIEFIVNGYINLVKDGHPQEDVVMMYYDTLDELTLLDIRMLKLKMLHLNDDRDSIIQVWQDYNIDQSQTNLINKKLSRLGLIESHKENEYEKLFDSVYNIIDYLEKDAKGARNNRLKVNHLTKSNSNVLTPYGRRFLKFFGRGEQGFM